MCVAAGNFEEVDTQVAVQEGDLGLLVLVDNSLGTVLAGETLPWVVHNHQHNGTGAAFCTFLGWVRKLSQGVPSCG